MKKIWINNGIKETYIPKTDEIPEGYFVGRLRKELQEEKDAKIISREELVEYYYEHSRKETAEHFGFCIRRLTRLLSYYGIKKPKDKIEFKNTRSHESYVAGGVKSAKTQRETWKNLPEEEKQAWRDKQKIAHSTEGYKKKKQEMMYSGKFKTNGNLYCEDGIHFDSSWELRFYRLCKSLGMSVERNFPIHFIYNGVEHVTFIDFHVNGCLYETKGSQFINGVYNDKSIPISEKLKIYKENNVTVITDTQHIKDKSSLDGITILDIKDIDKIFS